MRRLKLSNYSKNKSNRLKNIKKHLKKPIKEHFPLVSGSPDSVPSSIFQNRSFAVLETIVSFLKDNYKLNYHEIGLLLGRDERTIWTCYNRIKSKKKIPFKKYPGSVDIPIKVLKNRSISILESIVLYLKDSLNLNYHNIALLLNRNDRTIWTVYNRAKKKEAKR